MIKLVKSHYYCIFCLWFLLPSKQSSGQTIETPIIKAGIAKITGIITSPNDTSKGSIFVNIGVSHPVSGEFVQHKALIDGLGKFDLDVAVELDTSLIVVYSSVNPEKSVLVKSISGGVTNIDIVYNAEFDIKAVDVTPSMNPYDIRQSGEIVGKMIEFRPDRAPKQLYDKSSDEFLKHAKFIVSERLGIFVNNDTSLSKELKEFLSKEFRLFMYATHVFNYEGEMRRNYINVTQDRVKTPKIQQIDRTYFGFLKDFKLNDSQYLRTTTFTEFQNEILQNEILGLPAIGESDVPTWLASAKAILSDLVGFDNGQYYEILAANAYGRQLNEELRQLSEKQKENIAKYWKDGEISKILFRKNEKVVELDKSKSPAVVNDISSVADQKVVEAILSKHKNKVVFIDLWATWCGPCLEAMKEFRGTKHEFRDKDVAFVYLTNGSSPRKLWEEKIKGIGGEQYYLKASQWEYIMNHFGFEGIPSYLLYNKEGVLINKFTAFPGNVEVKEMIGGQL